MYYTFTNQQLTFVLEGGEQVAALKAKVSIPKEDIISIDFYDVFSDWRSMMVRMPGSYVPRFIMAGSYWTDEGWDFIYAHKPRGLRVPILHNVLVIETRQDKFKRVIIESTPENVKEICDWLNQ